MLRTCVVIFVLLLFTLPLAAQESHSPAPPVYVVEPNEEVGFAPVTTPAPAATPLVGAPTALASNLDSLQSVNISPAQMRELVRRTNFARRQRMREEAFNQSRLAPIRRHDLRFTFGFYPAFNSGVLEDWANIHMGTAQELIYNKYRSSPAGRHCFAACNLSYAHHLTNRWEVGVMASYTGYRNNFTPVASGYSGTKHREHYMTLMPLVRFAWVARTGMRWYSGFELGPQLALQRLLFESDYAAKMRVAAQVTFVGVTVGKKCYFAAELGYGHRGIINLGVGYKFGDKTTKR